MLPYNFSIMPHKKTFTKIPLQAGGLTTFGSGSLLGSVGETMTMRLRLAVYRVRFFLFCIKNYSVNFAPQLFQQQLF